MKIKDIENRRGFIKISYDLLMELRISDYNKIFKNVIIIKSEHCFWEKVIKYYVLYKGFDIINEGEKIPTYMIEAITEKGKIKKFGFLKQKEY